MNSGSCWSYSVEHNDAENIFDEPDKKKYGELKKAFAPGLGICSRGQVQKEYFEFEYYYPYLEGRGVTTFEDVYVERQAEKECYIGACDDNRVGVTIIFYLQNMVEYLQVCGTQPGNRHKSSLTLSALSVDGKIILPVSKNQEQVRQDREDSRNRTKLIEKARKGDEEAMESLTLEDIDTYSMISRRIVHEDLFTIVDTYFMPYGMECDKYSILGEILEVEMRKNEVSRGRNLRDEAFLQRAGLRCVYQPEGSPGRADARQTVQGNHLGELQGKINFL